MVRFLTGGGGREGGIEACEGSVASDPGVGVAEGTTACDPVGVAEALPRGRVQKGSHAAMDGIVTYLIGGVGV